jgi:Stress responsive A/B Barrel Domain
MLIHMVCFKYKPEFDFAGRTEHHERLRGLSDITGIIELKVGHDAVRSARSYDAGVLITFRDRAALDAYAKNPRHVPVAQFGAANCDSIVSVDFET